MRCFTSGSETAAKCHGCRLAPLGADPALHMSRVHVVTVYPGIVEDTEMGNRGLAAFEDSWTMHLLPRGTTAGLARLIHSAVEQRRARVLYPRINELARYLPALAQWLMEKLLPPLRV